MNSQAQPFQPLPPGPGQAAQDVNQLNADQQPAGQCAEARPDHLWGDCSNRYNSVSSTHFDYYSPWGDRYGGQADASNQYNGELVADVPHAEPAWSEQQQSSQGD